VDSILTLQGMVTLIVTWALFAVTIFAFISSLTFAAEAYRAAGKWSKQGWTILLGCAAVFQIVPIGIGIIRWALVIAALVYLADVRPALNSLRRR